VTEPPQRPDRSAPEPWRAPEQPSDTESTTPVWPIGHSYGPAQQPYEHPPAAAPSYRSPAQSVPPGQWGQGPAFGGQPPRRPVAPVTGWSLGSGPPEQPSRSSRVPWVPLALVTVLLGLGGGAIGATLVDALRGDSTTSATSTATQDSSAGGPISGSSATRGSAGGDSPVVGVAQRVLPSVVSIDVVGSSVHVSGSGFAYDRDGHIVTNNHVIEPAVSGGTIKVTLPDGRELPASIVGRSPTYDLAVLSVDGARLSPATLGSSDDVQVGETVVAIGSPLGLNSTVTSGIISATHRPVTAGGSGETSYLNALQTDAAINPGNSGGPLVNLDASVIGVNSAIATVGGGSTQRESGNIGVGFAIPIDQVQTTVEQIISTGHAVYPIIGAEVSVDPGYDGARIEQVSESSPAEAAGIQPGDVVTQVNGEPVHDGIELIVLIRTFEPGQTITLSVDHDGTTTPVRVVLGKKVG
jgi:putative serine protease PepD